MTVYETDDGTEMVLKSEYDALAKAHRKLQAEIDEYHETLDQVLSITNKITKG